MAVHPEVGIGRSPLLSGTILSGTLEVDSTLNLGRVYTFIVIRIPDCTNVAVGSSLRIAIGDTEADTISDYYRYSDGIRDIVSLPSAGSFRMELPVIGARRVIPSFDIVTTGDVAIEIYGVEPIIEGG